MSGKTIVLILILFSLFGIAKAQKTRENDKRNVLEYYKLLPSNMLDNEGALAKLIVEDIKNGYLKIEGAFEGYIEVALFRKKDGSGILVVGNTSCGPVCGTDLNAYEYMDDQMKEVTEDVMPSLTEDEIRAEFRRIVKDPNAEMVSFIYELPRFGKTIKILDDDSGKLIYSLEFKKDKFVITK
jgi:hypothetical protein